MSSTLFWPRFVQFVRGSGAANQTNDPIAGIIWVTIAMAFLAGINAFARHLALEGIPPSEAVFFRNLFCVIFMLPLLYWRGATLYRTDRWHLYGTRILLSFIGMTAMFHATALISIGEVTAISFLSPLFATLVAIVLLGERVRGRRWTALFVGFLGAIVILRPGITDIGLGQTYALIAACAMGFIGPMVKLMTQSEDADRVVFLTNVGLIPVSLVPAVFVWVWPPVAVWPALIGIGLCAVLGHMALVRGYATAEASLVQTFKFSRLPFAVGLGYLAFGEAIDSVTWVGAAIIFAAAVYITRRETRLKRDPTTDDDRRKKAGQGPGDTPHVAP